MEELIALEASFLEAEDAHRPVSMAIGTLAIIEGSPKLHGVVISGGRGTGKATLARASGMDLGSRLLTVRLVRGERPKLARAGRLEDLLAHAPKSAQCETLLSRNSVCPTKKIASEAPRGDF